MATEARDLKIDLSQAVWVKSSHSGNTGGNCVEVAGVLPGLVAVRDSKNPGGPVLAFTRDEWTTFIRGVKDGI
ncbi:DUF397 domain-containing protein [Sphaerisporangium fuscum]|uniref:DUF397 domain-containing protein n=1 Tax=Sphaerisporangium fuscum TaxID=2835868 RepID=UPI001BDBFA44|nr:DUF397 domain-containing protein [Sphaerisporangium fuscum]